MSRLKAIRFLKRFVLSYWCRHRAAGTGARGEDGIHDKSFNTLLVEVGPRLSLESAVSSNAKSICQACGIDSITRFEVCT